MNRETLLPNRPLASETTLVTMSIANNNIQKADAVKLKPKKSRWQAVGFRLATIGDTGKNKNIQSLSDSSELTEDSTRSSLFLDNTTTACISTRPSLEPTSHGCMKLRTQAESICRTFTSSDPCINDSSSLRPSVTFSAVEFHTHNLILGDNPSVSVGPPLGMSWKAVESKILDLEEYETSRPPRRDRRDLIVPRSTRVTWLRAEGYARSELAEAENEIIVIKKHRRTNARKGLWEKVREVVSSNDTSAQADDASIKRRRRSSYDLMVRPSLLRVFSRKRASAAS